MEREATPTTTSDFVVAPKTLRPLSWGVAGTGPRVYNRGTIAMIDVHPTTEEGMTDAVEVRLRFTAGAPAQDELVGPAADAHAFVCQLVNCTCVPAFAFGSDMDDTAPWCTSCTFVMVNAWPRMNQGKPRMASLKLLNRRAVTLAVVDPLDATLSRITVGLHSSSVDERTLVRFEGPNDSILTFVDELTHVPIAADADASSCAQHAAADTDVEARGTLSATTAIAPADASTATFM